MTTMGTIILKRQVFFKKKTPQNHFLLSKLIVSYFSMTSLSMPPLKIALAMPPKRVVHTKKCNYFLFPEVHSYAGLTCCCRLWSEASVSPLWPAIISLVYLLCCLISAFTPRNAGLCTRKRRGRGGTACKCALALNGEKKRGKKYNFKGLKQMWVGCRSFASCSDF